MRSLLLSSLAIGGAFLFPHVARGNQQPALPLIAEDNVNSRYTVESVEVAGPAQPDLTPSLQERVARMIGRRFDPAQFDDLAREIRKQLHLRSVQPRVLRGSAPDRVRVLLQTERRTLEFDISVPKFVYQSNQGWSAQAEASTTVARNNVFRFGLVSDGDESVERFTGFDALYRNLHTGSDRVHTALLIEEFHEQWDAETRAAVPAGQAVLYRQRRNLQPTVVLLIARPLTLTFGASLQQMQMEGPEARVESANAIIAEMDYHRRLEGPGEVNQDLNASYDLHAATSGLGSDYRYTRHRATVHYGWVRGKNSVRDDALAGFIGGNAPIFERFVVGNSSLLRGWNRFEIDPLGGNRIIHNSVQYGFRIDPGTVQAFYDAGTLWNSGQSSPWRHSVGIGYRQSVFSLAMAFPLRGRGIEPVFMVGMNY